MSHNDHSISSAMLARFATDLSQFMNRKLTSENLTVNDLISAIRGADDLSEMKRFIGPSEEEKEQQKCRIIEIYEILNNYSIGMPYDVLTKLKALNAEKKDFELTYGKEKMDVASHDSEIEIFI